MTKLDYQSVAPAEAKSSPSFQRRLLILGGIFLLALFWRGPLVFHSLWYDEMFTLIDYISQPWANIVAGQYSPNNHILFTLLAKLLVTDDMDIFGLTVAIRIPSVLAGALAAVAIAWPLRRERPYLALAVGLIAALHPWLLAFSGWARGYALLMCVSLIATHLLPDRTKSFHWPYIIALVAAMYTHPIAIAVVIGHAASMIFLRRPILWTWFRSAAVAGVLTLLLYMPFLIGPAGVGQYWSKPEKPSISYFQFLDHSLRHAHAGDNAHRTIFFLLPLLVIIGGSILAWRLQALRPLIVTFAVASAFALLIPLAIPLSGEVRAALWLIPLYYTGAAGLISAIPSAGKLRWLPAIGSVLFLVVVGQIGLNIMKVPAQPIREAVVQARHIAGPKGRVIGVYMASREAGILYHPFDALAYRTAADPGELPTIEAAEANSPSPPVAVVFYESFIQRDQPRLWQHLQENYTLVREYPGRISRAAIYRHVSKPSKQ